MAVFSDVALSLYTEAWMGHWFAAVPFRILP
jgi:hypothetical protein